MKKSIKDILLERILVLDGAMGTMIQSYNLTESDFRGSRLKDHDTPQRGNNDILSLTQPDIIADIHRNYLDAGADIIITNSFNASTISQKDYNTSALSYEMSFQAAAIACKSADEFTAKTPEKPRFVAGDLGPTNQTCSLSPRVEEPAYRNVTFDDLVDAYSIQVNAFLDAGVDILLVETVFDTLNCKAALYAVQTIQEQRGTELPVMVSGTITDLSGRLLSGQTVEAFWYSIRHVPLLSVGLNCAFGAEALRPFIEILSGIADIHISIHPNAGLPNETGGYDESPEFTARILAEFAQDGFVNLVGGCCGTTSKHIRAISMAVEGFLPRKIPDCKQFTRLSGLEPLNIKSDSLFVNIGERTNVAGSSRFRKMILDGQYEKALEVARHQVENGAQMIDVNMDEGLLDSVSSMTTFLNHIAAEPDISKVPIMVDSSRWDVISAGLRCIQGKAVVNSLSLKDGEALFIQRARDVRKLGAAVIIMAFDESGQADTVTRRLEILERAYHLLTDIVGFNPEDIIFDPNIYAIGTGIEAHSNYAVDFLSVVKTLKQKFPRSLVSGGVSNLSFSFRGNHRLREYIHSVFLYHAVQAGMDMGIVNAAQLTVLDDVPRETRELIENLIFNHHPDATDKLIAHAATFTSQKHTETAKKEWRLFSMNERIIHALVNGIDRFIETDLREMLPRFDRALDIIEGPLMEGMSRVGDLFGSGKMFLPQVVKSARVMKKAVAWLDPYLKAEKSESADHNGTIILATVKGDVHDIGKNIVSVVLQCNNYHVIDLGVMVPAEQIIRTAQKENADFIGLSGLITPSLDEMVHMAKEMERLHFSIPLLIGGATTSKIHTAVKVDPSYSGPTIYIRDASHAVPVLNKLTNSSSDRFFQQIRSEYDGIRKSRASGSKKPPLLTLNECRKNRYSVENSGSLPFSPRQTGARLIDDYPLEELREYIDWTPFFHTWNIKGKYPQIIGESGSEAAQSLFNDAQNLLDSVISGKSLKAKAFIGIFPANRTGDDIRIFQNEKTVIAHHLRQQIRKAPEKPNYCLSDFLYSDDSGVDDWIGAFVVTAGIGLEELCARFNSDNDDYNSIMAKALADRLAEALAERIHERIRKEFWGYAADENLSPEELIQEKYKGIRPAPGYPANPDHSEKKLIFDLLDINPGSGIKLTEHFMMSPAASVCGWVFAHPESRYFNLGKIGEDQLCEYAQRKQISPEAARKMLQAYV